MVIVCTIIVLGFAGFRRYTAKAQACGTSKISSSTTIVYDVTLSAEVNFSVWLDSCTNSEYASANIDAGSVPNLRVKIIRDDNLDSRENRACPTTGVCATPEMPLNGHKASGYITTNFIEAQTSNF